MSKPKFKVGEQVRHIPDGGTGAIEEVNVPYQKWSGWGVPAFQGYTGCIYRVSFVGFSLYATEEQLQPVKPEYYDPEYQHPERDTGKKAKTTLPQDSAKRKEHPLYSGPIKYFPAALAEVAKICHIGNQKHNPGEPLHWARGKSTDQEDCIIRHLIDLCEDYGKGVGRDENGVPQVGYIAWRALALAQIWLEKNDNKPVAPGAE